MNESCTHLSSHLNSTNSNIASTLEQLQSGLSAWLGQVDTNMTAVQAKLEEQDNLIKSTCSRVLQGFASLQCLSEEFARSQSEELSIASHKAAELKSELIQKIENYYEENMKQSEMATNGIREKAEEMEHVFKTMMANMVEEAVAKQTEHIAQIKDFSSTLKGSLSSELSSIESSIQSSTALCSQHVEAIQSAVETSSSQAGDEMETIEIARATAISDIIEIR